MIPIKDEGIILEATDLPFENEAVLNPTCIEANGITHMFYRAVRKNDFISSIGYCQIDENGKAVNRLARPVLVPEHDFEKKGVEDPRVVFLDGIYYLFYTAYDGKNALVAYATSKDLARFEKQGIISARFTYDEAEDIFRQSKVRERYRFFESVLKKRLGKDVLLWEKDAFIFPKKINGKFALIHRVLPGIHIAYFNSFSELNDNYWRKYFLELDKYIILDPKYEFESQKIGAGAVPIETEDGWLLIYHAVEDSKYGKIYHASAALLDRDDPAQAIGRLREPLFSPKEEWEKEGIVNNVVFPTGCVVRGGRLFIYYGASDKLIAAKSIDLKSLLSELKNNIVLN
ncbi:MAG: pesticidal protein Cry7Aa [Candidatus Moranbacteria bacterium CG_4_9_14_3_um_filter_40_7]|nr:MAG: pesticidal protein Cry7Aa [Candidatus Moranbacteria bacterium CG23_combo_of_CG06-09_8_20_14_all_40_16]PIU80686.1 MAG: pesticidal protein Cry7Aa [Candidatus Moranbacteria bacterium CG06_land_8_20_14_3_00_40_12]PJA88057.1 MAG: pesticidal protein Cry7Aa [Candidatus Moranbacteria bacterium CG_4_9_14_3_um_filter_40_7]